MLRRWSCVHVLIGMWALLATAAFWWPAAAAPPAQSARHTGKSRPFVPERLLRAFRGNREELRERALDDVERWHLAERALPDLLWKFIEPELKSAQVPDSLLRAVRIYSTLADPEAASRLERLFSAADPRVVMFAMHLAGERHATGTLGPLIQLRERPEFAASYPFRHALVSAVSRFREPAAIEFLVSAIASADGQLKYEIVRRLIALTGENFGGSGDGWKNWWAANRDGFRVPASSQPAGAPQDQQPMHWDRAVPQFFGTSIFARRVVFVIDHSRSMLSSVDGVTRMEQAARELEQVVRQLPDDTSFDIIAYNDIEVRFRGQLVLATPEEKSAAVRFIYALLADRKTDCYDTLADALLIDSNLEAMLFLSDGDPTAGTITDRATIVREITRQNALRRVAINTIAVDAEPPGEEFLKDLAAKNFGSSLPIR